MPMKKTDLAKNQALKIVGQMKRPGKAVIPTQSATAVLDRKAQRKLDQAAGLIPFATKLPQELVNQLNLLAQNRQVALSVLVAELLQKSLPKK